LDLALSRSMECLSPMFHGTCLSRCASHAVPVVGNSKVETGKAKRLLVVGEVGDGKSTLINALRDEKKSTEASAGKAARGVTKQVTEYVGKPIGGQEVVLLDTPGIGDMDVPLQKLFVLFEEHLADAQVDGVLVTTPVSDARMKLGAQVVKFLVEKGFVGGADKWKNIVLVGTKNDKADNDDRKCFRDQVVPELFASAPSKTGAYALVQKSDYTDSLLHLAAAGHVDRVRAAVGRCHPGRVAAAGGRRSRHCQACTEDERGSR